MEEPKLELLLLGPLQISIAGKAVPGLISLKAKALLAYLAVERHPIPRSTLAGLLWSDLLEADARRNLRVEISKLRRLLDPYLAFTHQDGSLRPDDLVQVDLYEFEDHLSAVQGRAFTASQSQLIKVASLYRADFLSGIQVRGAPLFEEWLVLERERLRQAALTLLDRLVETAIQQRDWEGGLLAARKSLSIDNLREKSHRQLINLLALSGDRPAALTQFEATRRILVQELGIEPGADTLALYQRVKAGDISAPAPPGPAVTFDPPPLPHNLPAPTTSFVGRETELEHLGELFTSPDCRLLTLTGPGGIGKTRLAQEICWKLVGSAGVQFKNGIYAIPLSAVQDGSLLHAAIADALKLPGSSDPRQQLIQYLSDKQLLLVLDNFEQLTDVAPELVEMLQRAPGVKLLVTSRHQLNLYEEWVFEVGGMPYPMPSDLSGWQNYTAIQLFQQRARRVNLRFSLEDNRECIISLCRILEGLPLGIELASAWVHALPCQNIVQLIEANLSLPDHHIHNLPSRQRSLQAVFQYSWDLLSEEEQRGLARLTVFYGGFTVQAAESVAEAPPRLLASLVAKSLLRFSPDGRYEMHSLLHAFAAEKLVSPDRAETQAAHSRYYAQFLTDCAQDFSGIKEAQVIAGIAAEIGNIRAGWQWALAYVPGERSEGDPFLSEDVLKLLAQYIPILSTFYLRKSWFREAAPVFSQAIDAMEVAGYSNMPPASRAPFTLGIACLAYARHCRALGQNAEAHIRITNGIQLLKAYGDSQEMADAWHNLGQIEQQTGSLAVAEEAFLNSLRIYRSLENPTGIASNLISLGVLAKNRGNLSEAAELFIECQRIFEQRGDQRGIWTCLINLGNIANVQQNYPLARRLYDQAYLNIQLAGDQSRQALTLVNLGSVVREINETDAALRYYQESLRISQEIGETRILVASLDGLGKTYLNMDNLEISWDYLLKAAKFAADANLHPQALDSLASLGGLMIKQGKPEQAIGILAYVLAQTYCPDHVRQSAERENNIIKTGMPADVIAKAAQEFRELSLDAVVGSLRNSDI